jgi:U3 small nucleolar RNA-associated protein 25
MNLARYVCLFRFHFYYRYKIKGIRTILFYQLPVNPHFFAELINMAQLDDGESVHSKILYSRSDLIRMQNIYGMNTARELVRSKKQFHALIGE